MLNEGSSESFMICSTVSQDISDFACISVAGVGSSEAQGLA